MSRALAALFLLLVMTVAPVARAIPPNTPFTNTATVSYSVNDTGYAASASETLITDADAGNSPPYGIDLATPQVVEGEMGAVVGTLVVADPDPGDTHTFTVDDPRFEVIGGILRLVDDTAVDFEAQPSVPLTITATDVQGQSFVVSFEIEVLDVNEAPFDLVLDDLTLVAGSGGAVVGSLSVSDVDAGDSHVYTVDDPRFEVVDGVLRLRSDEQLPLGAEVVVTVTATDTGGLSTAAPFTLVAVPPGSGGGNDAAISAYQFAPGVAGAAQIDIGTSICLDGSGAVPLSAPDTLLGGAPQIPGSVNLLPAMVLKSGEPLFLQVADPAANTDPAQRETIRINLTTGSGDDEVLEIVESAADSGIFVGYIDSAAGSAAPGSCSIEVDGPQNIVATYTSAPGAAPATLSILVDPFGLVFDSASGTPINGARVSLVNVDSGEPAVVFADDGFSPAPSTLLSGEVASSTPGSYRFPFVPAGNYALAVVPPNRFRFPSAASNTQMQSLPGAPFALVAGSRGENFNVPVGPAIRIDIPLDLLPLTPTPAALRLLAARPDSPGAQSVVLTGAACFDGSDFVPSGNPGSLAAGEVSLPGSPRLDQASRFVRGDAVFIELEDRDQDVDPFGPDTVEVEIALLGSTDRETIRLSETGDSTGIFTGFVQTGSAAGLQPHNCVLEAEPNSTMRARYVDADDAADTTAATALLDPGFALISAASGGLVSGATVTLLDASTGAPAENAVFAGPGGAAFPAAVLVGGTATDADGMQYVFAEGTFYFPYIVPGEYRLQVDPPAGWRFPSALSDGFINALPGGPFRLQPGSRGEVFTVLAAVPAAFDVPLDPTDATVSVVKTASKDVVGIGEFVQYLVEVTNGDAPVAGAVMTDRLPVGFRYVAGSVQIDGTAAETEVDADGRALQVQLPDLGAAQSIQVRYVAEVSPAAKLGAARNVATVVGPSITEANVAFADVVVREDLLGSKAIIIGQIHPDGCEGDAVGGVAAGVRVLLENGFYVVTDEEGKFHIEGLEPGTHVVQVDESTIADSHELMLCEDNGRFADNPRSQFVDLRAGDVWRADFYLAPRAGHESLVVSRLDAHGDDGVVTYRYRIKGGEVPLRDIRATFLLDEQLAYVPGSAKLNGRAVDDPAGLDMGSATFALGDARLAFDHLLEFDTYTRIPQGLITVKAVTQFKSAAGTHRTDVNVNDLSLDWPASLLRIAEAVSVPSSAEQTRRASMERIRRSVAAQTVPPADPAAAGPGISAMVDEPSLGTFASRSNVTRTPVAVPYKAVDPSPYQIPELDTGEAPAFDSAWLSAHAQQLDIVWPPERHNPQLPAIDVVVVHRQDEKPVLLVDGELVNPVTFEGTLSDHGRGVSLTHWSNVSISEHDSVLQAHILDQEGKTIRKHDRDVHFSRAPARAELVPEASYLVADGIYPPMLAVRLFDRAGYPLRAGATGEFAVASPYRPLNKARHLESVNNQMNNQRYRVMGDGIAYIQLEPTAVAGEAILDFRFDREREQKVRARLYAGARDWIMVGLVEGTLGERDLSGNEDGLRAADLQDEQYTDGRVAFYAKGMVKGQWLLTAAYDTDKHVQRRLREQIDPNRFYTLYGDGTEQRYDAESARKLYLKLERKRFAGLFGDYDTGFDRSHLARYERRLNGLNAGYFGDRVEAKAFASDTAQSFVRDELRGDGTSGIYRLSQRRLVVNSETVRIVTRDRFATERKLDEQRLARYLDYSIDYDRGTLLFKQPVLSQDDGFNPIFIEVEYEVEDPRAAEEIVAGARIAYRLDDQESEVAMTYIDDGSSISGGELMAADWTWQLNTAQKLTVEAARSERDAQASADAHLLEFEHNGEQLAGSVYWREQEAGFGLGHQSTLEADMRKYGVSGEYRVSEALLLRGESFRQQALSSSAERVVINARSEWRLRNGRVNAGLQSVSERTADGSDRDAGQILLGANRRLLGNKLLLRADTELAVSGGDDNTDYPSRAIIGAEYEVVQGTDLIVEQEFTWGDARDTQDTRLGVRARPWSGADAKALLGREMGENGERLFATTGLLQQVRWNEAWLFDLGMDRVQTLREPGAPAQPDALLFNPVLPPASGSFDRDFTALFTGVTYRRENWDVSSRLEFHAGDESDKWNLLVGANRQLAAGRVMAGSLSVLDEERADGGRADRTDLRFGLAWRPHDSPWSLFNRTDLVFEANRSAGFDTRSRKWVNNFNANYKPGTRSQLALQLGLKYVLDDIDGTEYDSTLALYGFSYRYDLNSTWDVGLNSSVLHSFGSDTRQYAYGVSLGFRLRRDAWVSVGYNLAGYEDEDFVAAEYTAQGPYLKIRFKLDQDLANRFLRHAGLEHRERR